MQTFTGELPPVSPQNKCLCPFPGLSIISPLICSSLFNRRVPVLRLGQYTRLPEFINDNLPETVWFSKNDTNELTITAELGRQYLVSEKQKHTSMCLCYSVAYCFVDKTEISSFVITCYYYYYYYYRFTLYVTSCPLQTRGCLLTKPPYSCVTAKLVSGRPSGLCQEITVWGTNQLVYLYINYHVEIFTGNCTLITPAKLRVQ